VLVDDELTDDRKSVEERIRSIAPISTTCSTYFSWSGNEIGKWGDFKSPDRFKKDSRLSGYGANKQVIKPL